MFLKYIIINIYSYTLPFLAIVAMTHFFSWPILVIGLIVLALSYWRAFGLVHEQLDQAMRDKYLYRDLPLGYFFILMATILLYYL